MWALPTSLPSSPGGGSRPGCHPSPLPATQAPCSHGPQRHVQSTGPELSAGLCPPGHHWVLCCGPHHRPLSWEAGTRGPAWGTGWGRLTRALRPGLWSCRDRPAPGCAFPSGRSPQGPSWRAGGALGDGAGTGPWASGSPVCRVLTEPKRLPPGSATSGLGSWRGGTRCCRAPGRRPRSQPRRAPLPCAPGTSQRPERAPRGPRAPPLRQPSTAPPRGFASLA